MSVTPASFPAVRFDPVTLEPQKPVPVLDKAGKVDAAATLAATQQFADAMVHYKAGNIVRDPPPKLASKTPDKGDLAVARQGAQLIQTMKSDPKGRVDVALDEGQVMNHPAAKRAFLDELAKPPGKLNLATLCKGDPARSMELLHKYGTAMTKDEKASFVASMAGLHMERPQHAVGALMAEAAMRKDDPAARAMIDECIKQGYTLDEMRSFNPASDAYQEALDRYRSDNLAPPDHDGRSIVTNESIRAFQQGDEMGLRNDMERNWAIASDAQKTKLTRGMSDDIIGDESRIGERSKWDVIFDMKPPAAAGEVLGRQLGAHSSVPSSTEDMTTWVRSVRDPIGQGKIDEDALVKGFCADARPKAKALETVNSLLEHPPPQMDQSDLALLRRFRDGLQNK